jgi:MFS family permease
MMATGSGLYWASMAGQLHAVDHTPDPKSTGIDRLSLGITVLGLGLGTGLSLLGDSTLYTVLPEPQIALQVGLTSGLVGIALGLNRLVRIGFNGVVGRLLDVFPQRRIMLVAMGIGILANLTYALAQDPWVFMAGRVLWGAAWSGIWVGTHATILAIAPPNRRGRLNGAYQAWFFGGAAATALMGGILVDNLGFRTTMWLSVASVVSGWVVWWRLLPKTHLPRPASERQHIAPAKLTGTVWRASLAAAAPYFAARFTLAGVLASTTILWLGQLLRAPEAHWLGIVPLASLTGAFSGMRTLTSLVGAPAAGRLSDWIGRRWGVIGLTMGFGSVGLVLMGGHVLSWAVLGALLVAICGGAVHALAPSLVGDQVEAKMHSRALGVVFSFGDLGSALGPPFALGVLVWMPIGTVYRACAGLLLIVAAFATWRSRRERPAADA